MLAVQMFDLRTFDGVDVWAKPTKFVVSVAVFALTTAWFYGYVRPDRRRAPSLRLRRRDHLDRQLRDHLSHGRRVTAWLRSFQSLECVFRDHVRQWAWRAVLLVDAPMPLAWQIWPAAPACVRSFAAVVICLMLCCAGRRFRHNVADATAMRRHGPRPCADFWLESSGRGSSNARTFWGSMRSEPYLLGVLIGHLSCTASMAGIDQRISGIRPLDRCALHQSLIEGRPLLPVGF